MFNFNKFLLDTINSMIENEPEYKVRQYAVGWYRIGSLGDGDMERIEANIELTYHPIQEEPAPEEIPVDEGSILEESTEEPETNEV